MNKSIPGQIGGLVKKVNEFSAVKGEVLVAGVAQKSMLFLQWFGYLGVSKTGVADELLDGAVSSLREVAACSALGLVRSALLAMRTEVDLVLSWLYFKDHPVEWEYVNSSGDGFRLKKEILEYLNRYYSGFGMRFGVLKDVKTRQELDPYRLLSAHIHAQSVMTLPLVNDLGDVVGKAEVAEDLIMLAHEVDEYLSDILFSVFGASSAHLPKELVKSVDDRLKSAAQKKVFYG